MHPEIKTITTSDKEYVQMLALRHEILRKPLGMSVYEDDLSNEHNEFLIVAMLGEELVGCTVLKKLNTNLVKLRQMAVSDRLQGKGVGAMLVNGAERTAIEHGFQMIELNARAVAIPFYEKLGYICEGPVFEEVHIPHRLMKKQLL